MRAERQAGRHGSADTPEVANQIAGATLSGTMVPKSGADPTHSGRRAASATLIPLRPSIRTVTLSVIIIAVAVTAVLAYALYRGAQHHAETDARVITRCFAHVRVVLFRRFPVNERDAPRHAMMILQMQFGALCAAALPYTMKSWCARSSRPTPAGTKSALLRLRGRAT